MDIFIIYLSPALGANLKYIKHFQNNQRAGRQIENKAV